MFSRYARTRCAIVVFIYRESGIMSIIVTIAGVETETSGINIVNAITHTPDICNFQLHDPSSVPQAGQEVICYVDSTSGTVLFAGTIYSSAKKKLAPNDVITDRVYTYIVECQDYSRLLNQRLVVETYASTNSKTIIDDIVANFTDSAHGFTTNNVATSRTLTRVVFNYIKVFDAISQLADLLEWDWYVDNDKDIHFFEKETRSAPFVINNDAVTNKINDLMVVPDYSQTRNRVFVRGGTEVSTGTKTQSWECDGEGRIWSIKHDDASGFSMTVGGAPVTVGTEYLNADDGTYAYYFNSNEKYVRAGDGSPTATPGAGVVIVATYNYRTPIIVQADNVGSQAAIAAIEGGDGIYESIIRDDSIDSTSLAQDRAVAEVNQFGNVMINGSFTTYETGFVVGQFVELDVPDYESYDGNYQIQRLSIVPHGPNMELYVIEFATTLYELKDFLLALVRGFSRLKLRSDEIVDVLKIVNETVTVTDSTPSTSLNAHPAVWGNPTMAIWDMFTWG